MVAAMSSFSPGWKRMSRAAEQLLPAPEFQIEPAERRPAIARHQPAGAMPGRAVEPRLFQQHAHQSLHAGEQDRLIELDVAAVEGERRVRETDIHWNVPMRPETRTHGDTWGVSNRSAKRLRGGLRSSPFSP